MKGFFILLLCPMLAFGQVTWTKVSTSPGSPVGGFAGFLIDSTYYIAGGLDSTTERVGDMWEYHILSGTWTQSNSFEHIQIGGGASTAYNEKGYLMNGQDSIGYYRASCWVYDPTSDVWDSIAADSSGRYLNSSFVSMGRLFTCFGYDVNFHPTNDLWEYIADSNKWVGRSPLPVFGLTLTSIAVVDSYAYVFGGRGTLYDTCSNGVWRYNVNQDKWDSLPPVPGLLREAIALYPFKNFILLAFGDYTNPTANIYDSMVPQMYRFDIPSYQWSQVSYMGAVVPTGIASAGAFQYGGKCYLYGGTRPDDETSFLNNLWMFDPSPLGPIYDTVTGISNLTATETTIQIYPNPTTDRLYFDRDIQCLDISIFDMTGRLCTVTASSRDIDVSALPVGIYCLRLQSADGNIVKKFLKE